MNTCVAVAISMKQYMIGMNAFSYFNLLNTSCIYCKLSYACQFI